jgi:DNA helicase-2/ATP-dependent DNA helicase PcrA
MADDTRINPEQKEAICYGEGPMLIIAGAGTGKTTVVVERIKHLIIEEKIPASEILALTFTEKAAREMEERVDIALPYGYSQMWMMTFHAFCDRILKQDGIHIGLNPGFRLLTETESMLFMRRNLYKFNLEYFRPLGNPYKFLSGMLQHFSRLKDDDISPEQYIAYAESIKDSEDIDDDEKKRVTELSHAFQIYEELKTKEGIMDFSDLIANVLKLLRTRKNILSFYQEKFKYILVDEFQDTNYAQNELAILLAGKRQNINVVGDDDQAIYRWRGAALANMIQFREHFPTSKIVTLNKNYRSTEEILTKSHQMIQYNNPDRLEIKEKINKQLLSMRGVKGEPIEFLFGPRVEHEAEAVIEKIQEQVKKHKRDYKDIAILVRANDHALPFVRAMERVGIPYQFLGPGHLFHQEEIKDLIAYLKVLVNFEDSAAMYRVLTMEVFGFSPRDIAAILNFAKKKNFSLFESLEQIDDTFLSDGTKENAKKLTEMIKNHLARVPRESAGQILYYFFENSGLLKQLLQPESVVENTRAQNIAKFFEKLKGYEAAHEEASVFAITDWIDLSMLLGESPLAADSDWSENNAVNILTIHSSKGLEFPVVFVVNLVTQRFPTRERKEQIPIPQDLIREVLPDGDQNISEERRLFYVAMTRAKDKLYLTAANYYGEGKRERKLSPFVYETLGEAHVNQIIQKKKVETSIKQLSLLDILPTPLEKEVQTEKADLPFTPITYISYSQINTYEMCPLHYKLKYILKIPPFPTPSLSYGTSVHAALRDYFQTRMTDPTIKLSAKELLSHVWINEGYESKSHEEQALGQAEKTVNSYIVKYRESANPVAIEVPFSFTIDRMKVGGRIDRIDKLPDGKIEIIDYKTGANVPDAKKLASDLQLTMYALAASEVEDPLFHSPPEEVILSLHYVEQDVILQTSRTKEQLIETKSIIAKKAEEIARSDYVCSVTSCKNCEYKMICKTFNG